MKYKSALTLGGVLVLMVTCALQSNATTSFSLLPDMHLLTPYATFGGKYNDSAVTINGNVGISENGTLSLAAPSKINGNLNLATGASKSGPGTVTGSINTGLNLSATQAEVGNASSVFNGYTADVTLGNVTTSQTFGAVNGVSDVYVIKMTSLTLGSGQYIHFSGDPGDVYVLDISGAVALTGDAAIGSLATDQQTIVNLTSTGNLGTIAHVGNVIYGTTLIPSATATLHSVSGAVYSGPSNLITLMSDATVNAVPFVPEPATCLAGLLLLLPLGASAVRILRKSR